MASPDEQDSVLRFLARFASMSEQERDAAVDSLSEADRLALIALAQARAEAAEADLLGAVVSGHRGLDRLREIDDPVDLLAAINLAARERPELVVEALFASVVVYRGWDAADPSLIRALREQWHWSFHQRPATQPREEPGEG